MECTLMRTYLLGHFLVFGIQWTVFAREHASKRDVHFLNDPCNIDEDCSKHINGSICDQVSKVCVCSNQIPIEISNYQCVQGSTFDSVCIFQEQCRHLDSEAVCNEVEYNNQIIKRCTCRKNYHFSQQVKKCVRDRTYIFDDEPNTSDDVVKGTVGGSIAMFTILLALIVWRKSKEYRINVPNRPVIENSDNNPISCICRSDLPPSYDDIIKNEKKEEDDEFKFPPSYQVAMENFKILNKNYSSTTSDDGIVNRAMLLNDGKTESTVIEERRPETHSQSQLVFAECHQDTDSKPSITPKQNVIGAVGYSNDILPSLPIINDYQAENIQTISSYNSDEKSAPLEIITVKEISAQDDKNLCTTLNSDETDCYLSQENKSFYNDSQIELENSFTIMDDQTVIQIEKEICHPKHSHSSGGFVNEGLRLDEERHLEDCSQNSVQHRDYCENESVSFV